MKSLQDSVSVVKSKGNGCDELNCFRIVSNNAVKFGPYRQCTKGEGGGVGLIRTTAASAFW